MRYRIRLSRGWIYRWGRDGVDYLSCDGWIESIHLEKLSEAEFYATDYLVDFSMDMIESEPMVFADTGYLAMVLKEIC